MFRLLKLAVYAAIGYMIYELYQGMQAEGGGGGGSARRGQSGGSFRGAGARQNVTGPGEGMSTDVGDVTGATRTETVGRGVVH
jgi:hypothetical protein